MPLPLVPLAGVALSYSMVALAGYQLARKVEPGRRCQNAEDAHDGVAEGVTLRREAEQANATARFRRVIRMGGSGPAVEIDASAFGRIRLRRL